MYYCCDCGSFFSDCDMERVFHAEVDTRRFEEVRVCPVCKSDDIEEAKRCPVCGNDYAGDGDICDECMEVALDMWSAFKDELQDTLGCDRRTLGDVLVILEEVEG